MTRMTVEALKREVEASHKNRRDYIVQAPKIAFLANENAVNLAFNGQGEHTLTRHAESQLAERLGIPVPYWKRMKEFAPALLTASIDRWMKDQDPVMLRLMGHECRAILSKKFRRIDNYDMLQAVLPLIEQLGDVEVWRCTLTERRMYVHFATPQLEGEVSPGDVVRGGFVMSNSEIGERQFQFQYMLGTLRCKNGAIMDTVLGRAHIGTDLSKGLLPEIGEINLSQETTILEDAALMSRVRDALTSMLSVDGFQRVLNLVRNAENRRFNPGDFAKAVESVAEVTELSASEKSLLQSNLMNDGGKTCSAWRIVNALTAISHETEGDRAVELEQIGGRLLAEANNPSSQYWLRN